MHYLIRDASTGIKMINFFSNLKDNLQRLLRTRKAIFLLSAVLLQIENTKELVLVEQFRYSAARTGDAWMLEIIAGLIEKRKI